MFARVGILLLCCWFIGSLGCQAEKLSNRLTLREGPPLKYGRMSSSLGAVVLKDKRVVIVGGSPTEYPFAPLLGTKAVEILNPQWSQWQEAGIDVPYPISGKAYLLPDGRILAFTAIYVFNPSDDSVEPPKDSAALWSGAVSAVILDLDKKTQTPIYRPKHNTAAANATPLKGTGPYLLQRAFARSLQLKDGRIIRIGGRLIAQSAPPKASCDTGRCRYCSGGKCQPHPDGDYICKEDKECPAIEGTSQRQVLKIIEIYTPPDASHPLGQVKRVSMDEGRYNLDAIELLDGRVFLVGGIGPTGAGPNATYNTTYLLNPNTGELRKGPRLRVAREDHSLALLDDGKVLITGGTDQNESTTNVTELFDPTQERLTDGFPMDVSREDHQTVPLGPWLLFLGGEDNNKSDLIRNSGEAFDRKTGIHISSFFLFTRESSQTATKLCPNTNGFAGIDDFAAVALDRTHVLLLGGQQGCQDRDGDYISPGKGSQRTLFIEFPQP